MKKWICLLLCLTLTLGVIAGCKGLSAENPTSGSTAVTSNTATTESTNHEPASFDLEALQAQIPEELKETMKLEAVRYLHPNYSHYDDSTIESKKKKINFVFYAVFDDVYVVVIDNGYTSEKYHVYEQAEDLLVAHYKGEYLRVYCAGQYYTLQGAYDAQLIDRSQLETVTENYYTVHPEWIPESVPGEYSDALSDELRAQIEAFNGGPGKHDDQDSVAGWHYYGTYNGYAILMSFGSLDWVEEINIGGRIFSWSNNFAIIGFKNNIQYELESLYAIGHITEADVDELLVKHDAYYLEYLDSLRKSFVENMLQEQYDQPIFWYISYEEYLKDPQGRPVVYLGEVEGYYVYAVYSPEKPAEAGLTIGSFTFASPVECEIFVFDHAKGLWVLSEAFYSQEVTEEFIGKVHAIWPTEPQPESYWPETPENPSPDLLALTELFGAWGTLYNSALTSTYESPAFINLCFFLEGVSKDHAAQLTPEEQAAFADYGIENMEVFRYTREDVDEYLQQHFGITSADLDEMAVRSLAYLESTDCYYIFTNGWDGHVRGVNVIAAETQDDGTILMYYTTGGMPAERLIARIQPTNSGYIILSNQTP